jgi:hypothetical protein
MITIVNWGIKLYPCQYVRYFCLYTRNWFPLNGLISSLNDMVFLYAKNVRFEQNTCEQIIPTHILLLIQIFFYSKYTAIMNVNTTWYTYDDYKKGSSRCCGHSFKEISSMLIRKKQRKCKIKYRWKYSRTTEVNSEKCKSHRKWKLKNRMTEHVSIMKRWNTITCTAEYCHIYIVAKHNTYQEMLSVWSIRLTASHMIIWTVKYEWKLDAMVSQKRKWYTSNFN